MKINKEKESQLAHSELLRILDYSPETGIFTWKIKISRNVVVGRVAGSKNKGNGYIEIKIYKKHFLGHRLAWFYVHGYWPVDLIDHKNRIRHENWIDNLREADGSFNLQNQQLPSSLNTSSSKVPGVTFRRERQKWRVVLTIDKKDTYFGHYSTQEEAEAVCLEKRRLHYAGNLL